MKEDIPLQNLVAELIQGDDSLVNQYNDENDKFPCSAIDTANQEKLDKEYLLIQELLLRFQENYRQLFKIAIKESTSHNDKITARTYLEISELYINIIQNIYLNPINYRLNKLNNEKSIKKANWSIYIGIASIFIGFILTICGSFFAQDSISNSVSEKTQIMNTNDSCKNENNINSLEEALSPIDPKQ